MIQNLYLFLALHSLLLPLLCFLSERVSTGTDTSFIWTGNHATSCTVHLFCCFVTITLLHFQMEISLVKNAEYYLRLYIRLYSLVKNKSLCLIPCVKDPSNKSYVSVSIGYINNMFTASLCCFMPKKLNHFLKSLCLQCPLTIVILFHRARELLVYCCLRAKVFKVTK